MRVCRGPFGGLRGVMLGGVRGGVLVGFVVPWGGGTLYDEMSNKHMNFA